MGDTTSGTGRISPWSAQLISSLGLEAEAIVSCTEVVCIKYTSFPKENVRVLHDLHEFKSEPVITFFNNHSQTGFSGLQTSYTRPVAGGLWLYTLVQECN